MFKPGEMVKCNIFDGYTFLKGEELYHVYAVKNVSFSNQMLRLTGDYQWFYAARFEQWPNPLDRAVLPFTEGDKIVATTDFWYFEKGDVFTIAEMRPGILRFNGSGDWFTWELFEKADETDQKKEEAKTMLKEDTSMKEKDFRELAIKSVVDYFNSQGEPTDKNSKITADQVFIVWMVKVLQNNKCLLSTTVADGMYYEFTWNGDKNEGYLDAYKKWKNITVKRD